MVQVHNFAYGILNPGLAYLMSCLGCFLGLQCTNRARAMDGGMVTLYSDLLLHDMGSALDDKIVQGDATGADWRTTPLLAIRLRPRYLHDGRAATLRDAVLAHGGEAQIVRDRFLELDDSDRQALYDFLKTL